METLSRTSVRLASSFAHPRVRTGAILLVALVLLAFFVTHFGAISILGCALLYWGIASAGFIATQRRLVFPAYCTQQEFGVPKPLPGCELLTLTTQDGKCIPAYWRAPRPGRPTIVSFHGNASSPIPHAERFADGVWKAKGWGMLAIGWRGYPGATGKASEDGLIQDAETALAFVRNQAPDSPVVLHGHSLGSGPAIAMAAQEPDITGVYLEAPFASIFTLACKIVWWMPSQLVALCLLDPFHSDARAPRITAPVFIAHGTGDTTVPFASGKALAKAFTTQVIFRESPTACHRSIFGLYDEEAERFFSRS